MALATSFANNRKPFSTACGYSRVHDVSKSLALANDKDFIELSAVKRLENFLA